MHTHTYHNSYNKRVFTFQYIRLIHACTKMALSVYLFIVLLNHNVTQWCTSYYRQILNTNAIY